MLSEQTAAQPQRRAYLVFAVVGLALLMSSLDMTIVAIAIPTMLRELHTNLAWIGWTLTSYQLAQTIVMPLAGKLSDDWGRKRLFLGAVVFGFFSFIPYYATIAYGMTASESGAVLTPRSLTMMALSMLSSLFLIRLGYRMPMIVGSSLVSLSLFVLSRGYHDVTLLGLQIPNLVLLVVPVMVAGAGLGIANPASSNAALDLIPEKMAAVAGLRGMFRSLGGVVGTAALILALSHFDDKAVGLEYIFLILAFVMFVVIALVFFIPDLAHERRVAREWKSQEQAEGA